MPYGIRLDELIVDDRLCFIRVDTPTIWATINGIQRAGFTVFLVSVRNSPVAVAHLLKVTNARALFVSGVPMLRNLAQAAVGETGLKILDIPKFDAIFKKEDPDFTPLPPFSTDSLMSPAMILHSSGAPQVSVSKFSKPYIFLLQVQLHSQRRLL